jgi:hypothetical protein
VDGEAVWMIERAKPTKQHDDTVCAYKIPADTRSLMLHGEHLPLPVSRQPKKIVVVGDTGCRLSESHGYFQACNNSSVWPFARIAESIAAYEPDLILYAGDYIYREAACPDGNNGCKDSPFGDNHDTWIADWLQPARPIHRAAPLVLARGNHETCTRAGKGWFRYLDARPLESPEKCLDSSDPWVVNFRNMQVGIMDVANTKANGNSLAELFAHQLDDLDLLLNKPSWIMAHRPFWGYGADDDNSEPVTPTSQLQVAVDLAGGLPRTVDLLLGSHIHLAEIVDFGGQQPPQLVVGNGGTQLIPYTPPPAAIAGLDIESTSALYQFGFVTVEFRGQRNWLLSFRDVEGRILERCRLHGWRTQCDSSRAAD